MSKTAKTKARSGNTAKYLEHGWKNVHSSDASSVFVSTMPARVKNNMITASKEKKILATGSIFVGFFSRANNN